MLSTAPRVGPGLAAYENEMSWLPLPLELEATVSQELLVVAIQEQPDPAVRFTVPDPAL